MLSSQANITYRAVIEGATDAETFAGQMTAAVRSSAKVLLLELVLLVSLPCSWLEEGCHRVRLRCSAAAKEQVEAVGAKFLRSRSMSTEAVLGLRQGMSPNGSAADDMLLKECANMDVIITTALIPGRPAPGDMSTTWQPCPTEV